MLTWPMIRLIQRLSMFCTLGCGIYVLIFLFLSNKGNPVSENVQAAGINSSLLSSPVFELDPYAASLDPQARDIFSFNGSSSETVKSTPQGQLPDHLKIVGVIIAHPSQVIIEDGLAHKTHFIDEGSPKGGFNIVRVSKDTIIINYQGQEIVVPVGRK